MQKTAVCYRPACGRHRYLIKTFLVMQLTTIFFLLGLLHVSANGLSQNISYSGTKVPLSTVFKQVEAQGQYHFLYDQTALAGLEPVTITVSNVSLASFLDQLFRHQPLKYKIWENNIIVSRKPVPPAAIAPSLFTPQPPITGVVYGPDSLPVAGATITIKGTHIATTTNASGHFTIEAAAGTTLVISSVGHVTKEVRVEKESRISVVLMIDQKKLVEVVVNAGYWKVSDKHRTGSISKVSGETVRQSPVSDPMLALAGRVPGLEIAQISGMPGAYASIRIRGTNSIANGNDPLILVDGIPFTSSSLSSVSFGGGATSLSPFSLLNAQEIESIEVLKDADATAIYGSRGANGVILITTRKGKAGKTRLNIDAYSGAGKVTKMTPFMNTTQYLEMRREAFKNDGIAEYPASAYDLNGTWDENSYTDWQELLIGNTAQISSLQAQVSGGNANTQFTAGGGWMRESAILPDESRTNKSSANLSINHRSTDQRFGIAASVRYLLNNGNQPITDVTTYIKLPPNAPAIYKENGELNWVDNTWTNPFGFFLQRAKSTTKNLIANGVIDYKIMPNLQAKINAGYSEQNMLQTMTTPIKSYPESLQQNPTLRSHRQATNALITWILEPQLNYALAFGKAKLEAVIGTTFQKSQQRAQAISASNFTDDALIDNIAAASQRNFTENRQTEYRYAALFGRVNINWEEKYLLNLVARRDGSSRFAPARKYGNFASAGAAWIFSKEDFIDNDVLSFGKIRASMGVTGNDQLADYQYFSTYSTYNAAYLNIIGLYPSRLHSPDYGWESVRKLEAGLDLGFLKDRVQLAVSLYRNRTGNQLVGYSLPSMTGFSTIQANLPAVIENRGIELELNTINIQKTNFHWNTALNISIPRNKLLAFPGLETSSYRNTYEIGKSLHVAKRWHFTGVDPATGIVQYEDVNKDGVISSPEDLQSLIHTAPRFLAGLSNTLKYRGFQLDIFFQFVKKTSTLSNFYPGRMGNLPTYFQDRWKAPGDQTRIPMYSQGGTSYQELQRGAYDSDLFYSDASFVRLKNLTLSYNLPARFLSYIKAANCRFYLQGQNLFTFTKYPYLDPETYLVPPIRMLTAGLNITF